MANRLSKDERLARAYELGIIVDPEYVFLLEEFSWRVTPKGYVETTMYDGTWRKTVKLHHFIAGTPIPPYQVDHDNRNKLDNRKHNLIVSTPHRNAQNKDQVDRASNIRITRYGAYEVRIQRDGVMHQVGTFRTEEDAIKARDMWYGSKTAA